ncbi:MAG: GntR family transcriptional regulator [Planctomycetaceae bacterium]|nr:GntR family transcriptional regulator [Planctomycetaceae bacterium]
MASITRTIREQVTNQIRDDVVACNFAPGTPLREGELAERFGVSRGPIRDAFLQLSQEGFLAYQANRGVTVRQAPDADNRDFIVSLRQQIECYVIRRGLRQLDDAGLAKIEAALRELKLACAGDDVAAVARCDMGFHAAVMLACDGEDFLPVWKLLCSQMLLAYTRLNNYEQVFVEHVEILQALRDGKKRVAIATIKANIR